MALELGALSDIWQGLQQDAWLLLLLLVGALAMLLLLARPMLSRRQRKTLEAAPMEHVHQEGDFGIFSLVARGTKSPFLRAKDEELASFEDFVVKIYEVSHGIFQGEEGGERLPSWPSGAFTAALQQLRPRAETIGWPKGGQLYDPLDDVALASRLIATGLNVDDALDRVQDYRDYRDETGGGVVPPLDWLDCGIAIVPCEDRLGRPIINIRPRYHRPGNAALFRKGLQCTLDAVKAHFLHNRKHTFSETNPLEQYSMVWDFQGAGRKNLDWDCFNVTIEEGTHHYPNMGSQIYVLNVSAPVRWVWYAARRFLHPRIRRKCLLVAPRDVPALMCRLVSPEKLPPEYGGTGMPWVGPQEAVCFEDQVGELAAAAYTRAGVVPKGAKPLRKELLQAELSEKPLRRRALEAGPKESSGCSGILSCCGGLRMKCCL
mmetsp:Transcript_51964/g.93432  ORF Transcript_51964/g.93432 Transcript_51964/m.93432 type:complete len:432 (-) Transcript_51964:154-1449(-)